LSFIRRLTGSVRSRTAIVTVVLLACLAIGTVPFGTLGAQAHVRTFHSRITIKYSRASQSFTGRVKASTTQCRRGRRVTIFLQLPQRTDKAVGHDVTNARGAYGPVASPGPGSYYAQVEQVSLGGYGHDHLCAAATSRTIRVRAPWHWHGHRWHGHRWHGHRHHIPIPGFELRPLL